MSLTPMRAVRWAFIAAGVIAYPVLAHYSAATSAAATLPSLGVAVSLLPALLILLVLTWRSSRRAIMALVCVGVGALLWGFWGALEHNFSWVYFLQHAGTNVMLAAVFGLTLAHGQKALCTRFAETVHRTGLPPEAVRYTRQITLAWTLFFLAMSLTSGILFFFFSIQAWSVFANFFTLPLVLLMFAVEYAVRLRKLPHLEKHSILDGMRAYWKSPGAVRIR